MTLTRASGWTKVQLGSPCRDCEGVPSSRHRCPICRTLHLRAIARGDLTAVARDLDDLLHYVTTLPDDLAVEGTEVHNVLSDVRWRLADALESLGVAGVLPC